MRTAAWAAITVLAALLVAPAVRADEPADRYEEIRKLGDRKLESTGKTREAFREEAVAFFKGVIDKCEAFRKQFPDAPQKGEVMYEAAKSWFYLSRYSKTKREDMEAGVELALKVVALDPKAAAAAKSRGLLIQYYMMNDKKEEALREAEAIVADHAATEDAPLALRYVAEINEGLKRDKEAQAAWEKLAANYADTPHGRRAAGILAFPKLKGRALEIAFVSAAGQKVDAKDLRGRVALVLFWSATDETSTSNLALLASVDKVLQEKGLSVIGVCLESRPEAMEPVLKKADVSWPQHCDGKRWNSEFVTAFGVRSIPMTILADRSGKIREVGLLGNSLLEAIRRLIDEK